MKFLLIILICSLFISCTKKIEKVGEQNPKKDTNGISDVKKDSSKTTGTKKEKIKPTETQTDSSYVKLTYEQKQGKYFFIKYCAICHGEQGSGNGFNAFNLNPKPGNLSDSSYMSKINDSQLIEVISKGGKGVNKSPLMPAYNRTLKNDAIQFVADYVRFLSGQKH
jgi:mono/diheme cytochrome c family protein